MSQTKNKTMNKKILIAAAAVVVLAVVFGVIYTVFSPKATVGAKKITVEVVDNEEKSTNYTVQTDAQYLRQALEEIKDLTIEGTESEYGLMVATVNGVKEDYNTDGAYWSFYVDGEYCNYGVDQQPIEDGQAYRIVYTVQ